MKSIFKYLVICLIGATVPVQALDIFGKTAREIENNFMRPLSDMKNTMLNTSTIFKGIETPTDRLRVAGGFMKEASMAMDKLTLFVEYLNNKFINSILSKNVHNKVQEVINEARAASELLQKVADGMRMYNMNQGEKEPVMRSGSSGDNSTVSE